MTGSTPTLLNTQKGFTMKNRHAARFTTLAAAAATLLALTACSSAADPAAETTTAPASDTVTIDNAWVKSADEGMSAAFGELKNTGSEDVVVTSAETSASDGIELHETVENESGEMVMREKDGGFTIPAGGTFELAPGGNHIMLMGLTAPVEAGDDIEFTLTFSDDSTYTFTAPAKDYSGANENYVEGDMDMDMDMGDGK